jgi:CheY-like chemotaxis protein
MPLDLFSRKLILLVEDQPLIAYDLEREFRKAGARVIAAGHLDAALPMAEHPDLSGAVIDLRLRATSAIPVCRRLVERKIPFIVHTGYAADAIQQQWPAIPIIQKPARPEEVADRLAECLKPACDLFA